MRRLRKRWESIISIHGGSGYRMFLPEVHRGDLDCDWGCIEFTDLKGPFQLEIWNGDDEEWEMIGQFPTLKQAKEVGRLLAGIALAKNI